MPAFVSPKSLTGSQFSTYRIGGPIANAYLPTTLDEAIACLEEIASKIDLKTPAGASEDGLTVIGWGSNSLFATVGIPGHTLLTRKLAFVRQEGPTDFIFGAGVHLAKVAKVAQDHALTGAEFFIGIPGTAGGAVCMNAGAMGQEAASVITAAHVFNLETNTVEVWPSSRLAFQYRTSAIRAPRHIVLAVEMTFQPGDPHLIGERMAANLHFRKTHHPTEPNGGSVFRNPVQGDPRLTVGYMLDQLGAKAWEEGGVRISSRHANFIINHTGRGTSTEVLTLMARMKEAIARHFNQTVFPENFFIGAATPLELRLWKELTDGSFH